MQRAIVSVASLLSGMICLPATAATHAGSAAAAKPCVVWTDPSGDAGVSAASPGQPANDPGLDLTAGILSGKRSTLDLTVKVADLRSGVQVGRVWQFSFGSSQRDGAYYSVIASEQADGEAFAIYGPGTKQNKPALANVTGSIDPTTNSISMQVPMRLLGPAAGEFDSYTAYSARSVGTSGALVSNTPAGQTVVGQPESTDVVSDTASGARTFTAGRGCS